MVLSLDCKKVNLLQQHAFEIEPTQVSALHSLALWLYCCWWSHVEITSIHSAVISFFWDQWHAWSKSFSFAPTDPLFSPIQPWWLLSHHCLQPPLEAQWIPVCHPVCQTDFYLLRNPQLMESLLLPIWVAEWLLTLICSLPFFSRTGYVSLTLFRCDKIVLCLGCWILYSFLYFLSAPKILP